MSRCDVVIIDYGMGNLLSVRRGLEHCGASVVVTTDPDEILSATRVVLPGVGAFADGMAELRRNGLDVAVRELAGKGTPLLGICLGMQMLLDESEEFGRTLGLGLIPGRVVPVPSVGIDGLRQKIPHIGWNGLVLPEGRKCWGNTLLHAVVPGEAAYFVHSFMASPTSREHSLANCLYGGQPVTAAIGRGNIVGCQFHPEKSGEVGLKILRAFCAS
ncbi:MAG: imidazole glycerol phosphate synthase subunit HisH [Rhodocyclaceae bacterium]|jgi:glutamine amidotransferase|nr:imidazole glycerol phosphate synthase subunit HisH [Rhodocyclaceae bacterium]